MSNTRHNKSNFELSQLVSRKMDIPVGGHSEPPNLSIKIMPWLTQEGRCPCCGSLRFESLYSSPDRFFGGNRPYEYNECRECASVALNPVSKEWSVQDAYPENYPAHTDINPLRWYHYILPSYFFPRIPRQAHGPVLEIGGGTGLYIHYLKQRFPDAMALEMDKNAVAAAQMHGRPVFVGSWESCVYEDSTVGVLIMNQVIEHLVSPPDATFRKAFRILDSGGLWVIRTPNSASWGRAWFREYWHPLEVPRHTVIYSDRGLLSLAERHGFCVEHLRYVGRPYDIRQSACYMNNQPRHVMRVTQLASKSVTARIISLFMNLCRRGDHLELVLRKR